MIEFDEYKYYPSLRTRAAEILGLEKLSYQVKEKILPIITLGKWPRNEEIQTSFDKAINAMEGLPFILDVTKEEKHHCLSSKSLLSPEDNFSNWRSFCLQKENVIPIIQMPDNAKLREIVQQARMIEKEKGRVAFRIKNINTDVTKVISSLISLDNPERSIVFIDLGYVRGTVPIVASAAITAINQLRNEIPELIISVLTTSFPNSVTNFCRENANYGYIDMLERELYQSIGGKNVVIYGDHSSIHSVVYDDMGGRYVPRIDIALDDAWYFERRPGVDSQGYIDAAKSILLKYPEYNENTSWGALMIRNAAKGDISGMGSPAKWIAVRVNQHITRQSELCEELEYTDYIDDDF